MNLDYYLRKYEYKNNKLFLQNYILFSDRLKNYILNISTNEFNINDLLKLKKFGFVNRNKIIFMLDNIVLWKIRKYNLGYYNNDLFILCDLKKYNIKNKILFLYSFTYELVMKKINVYYIHVAD